VRAAARIYGEAGERAVKQSVRGKMGTALVDILAERYADAAISSGEGPEPTADNLAEAVAMHLYETAG
jgi:hypothetical protein